MGAKTSKLGSTSEPDWEGDAWFSTPRSLCNVTSAGGRLLAGGYDILYMLRPGEERTCELKMHGSVTAVAVDATAPDRFAAATDEGQLLIFDEDARAEVNLESGTDFVDSLAWSPFRGEVTLWVVMTNGHVSLWNHAARTLTPLDIDEGIHFVRAGQGRALLADADSQGVWVFDGEKDTAPFIEFPPMGDLADVATAGEALAVAASNEVWIRRSPSEMFFACTDLELPKFPVFSQIECLAFEGRAPGASLFVGYRVAKKTHVGLIDANGKATQILEVDCADDGVFLKSMTWDESRRALFTAWHGIGLMFSRRKGSLVRLS